MDDPHVGIAIHGKELRNALILHFLEGLYRLTAGIIELPRFTDLQGTTTEDENSTRLL